ncbi:MAG: universal stress protein [Maribacter sp.]|uniref:universal stress protein n=1 Tax=Maribacter sp. TaxID=1897614 RepID=UPI003C73EE1E
MGKKLVLLTDFSWNSWNAIQYAIRLFKNCECEFYIMNAYAKEVYGLDSFALLDPDEAFNTMSEKRSKERLGDIMERLMLEHENSPYNLQHRFHVLSRSEHFIDAVKNIVEELQIDMVVMGAKGISNNYEGRYGKNTLEVIKNIRACPVLVVPKNVVLDRPEEIVLTTNFNTDLKISEIESLIEIAKISGASIQVLSLVDNGSFTLQQKNNKLMLRKYLKGIDHSFNVLHNVEMATALNCFVEIKHSNMISYIAKKPSFLEKWGISKSTLGKLGYFEDVPVLALHG